MIPSCRAYPKIVEKGIFKSISQGFRKNIRAQSWRKIFTFLGRNGLTNYDIWSPLIRYNVPIS